MSFTLASLRIGSGVILWAAHFAIVYGGTALACARDMPGMVPVTIGVATLVASVLAVAVFLRQWRHRETFEAWLGAWLAALALFAILLEAVPVLIVPPCG